MAINNAPIFRSPFSHYFLNYGFHSCVIPDVLRSNDPLDDVREPVANFLSRLQTDWHTTRTLAATQSAASETQANKHRTTHTFAVGDRVLVSMAPYPASSWNRSPPTRFVCNYFPASKSTLFSTVLSSFRIINAPNTHQPNSPTS